MNNRILLDSNIIIYTGLVDTVSLHTWLYEKLLVVSSISLLEVMGYHKITPKDLNYFQNFFEDCEVIPVRQDIIQKAVKFRQEKKMSLGDSIIAATAFQNKIPLVTANIKDFNHIPQLKIINPIQL